MAQIPNFAGAARGYITSFIGNYNQKRLTEFLNKNSMTAIRSPIEGRVRVWFNEEMESRNFIIPGIIALIIMIVGAMMTSLVIAREYEHGTPLGIWLAPEEDLAEIAADIDDFTG
ncbi:MAG: hypothetical protein HC887_13370, partial [Desulfobacteraceae bacterium]|nr:hypothetical protein [Desulfobacteraceae bacterium]